MLLDLLVVLAVGYGLYTVIRAITRRVRGQRQDDGAPVANGKANGPAGSPVTPSQARPSPVHASPAQPAVTTPIPTRTSRRRVNFRGPAQWIPAGQKVEIHGYFIPGGMFYVGSRLPSARSPGVPDPALINPTLPVRRRPRGWPLPQLPYWPSYSQIPPEARAAYLEWLAGGRQGEIDIGYVFLFFYGLERRVLLDRLASSRDPEVTDEEVGQIAGEVRRLLALYGSHRSFRRYGTAFLGVCQLLLGRIDLEHAPELDEFGRSDPPLALRLGLGIRVAQGKPIPADWALAWLHCDPEYRPRTAALRCRDEFRTLFAIRYQERFGEGLVIRPNKTKLTIEYQPASATFGGAVRIRPGDIPDVTSLRAPLNKIRQLAEECTDELDPYSRWLARSDADRNPMAGFGLLPPALQARVHSDELRAFFAPVESALAEGEVALLDARVLLKRWATTSTGKLRKRDAVLLADLLAARGFGMAPDIRFDGESPTVSGKVAVFRGGPSMPSAPSPEYASAVLLIRFAATLALSDGEVSGAEVEQFRQLIARLDLESTEKIRLRAYLEWLLSKPVSPSWKTQLNSLPAGEQRTIAEFLLSVAAADGKVSKAEVDTLRKIYAALGLAEEQLYSDLHARTAQPIMAASEPVPVAPAEPGPTYRIPPRPAQSEEPVSQGSAQSSVRGIDQAGQGTASPVRLDMERVRRKMIETAQVSQLLRTVFADEDEVSEPVAAPAPAGGAGEAAAAGDAGSGDGPGGWEHAAEVMGAGVEDAGLPAIDGLEKAHVRLLRVLGQRPSWPRVELERVADEYGLLLDGALEEINEVAFDRCGGPIVEGDDPIEVDQETLKALIG